jgi:hypothetical protein
MSDDISQEALRRIAENKRKAEEALREKNIQEEMKKIEYDALPKCLHGVPNDYKSWNYFCETYKKYEIHRGGTSTIQRIPTCTKCMKDAEIKQKKEDDDKAAAEAAEAMRIKVAADLEQSRVAKIARDKTIEETTNKFKANKNILNFTHLWEDPWYAETIYLQREGINKYVPIAYGINCPQRFLLGDFVSVCPTPTQWETHFKDGLIPFLPVCLHCLKPTQMKAAPIIYLRGTPQGWPHSERYIDNVYCEDGHYKWIASSGKHYRGEKEWDPTDPDGSKAAAIKRAAEISSAEKQIAELQARIQELKLA